MYINGDLDDGIFLSKNLFFPTHEEKSDLHSLVPQ